jgi:hypothetical protein
LPSDAVDEPELTRAFRIKTRIGFHDTRFDFDENQLQGQVDFGLKSVNTHWLNPYIRWQMPRRSSYFAGAFTSTLGTIFHFRPSSQPYWLRYQGELTLGSSQPSETPIRPDLGLVHNWTFGWRNLRLGLVDRWDLTNEFSRSQAVSVSISEKQVEGFLQADINAKGVLAGLDLFGSFEARPDLKVYTSIEKNLESNKKELNLAVGVDYAHASGLGAKLGYFHQDRLAVALSFTLNKTFSGSFLFDVGCN